MPFIVLLQQGGGMLQGDQFDAIMNYDVTKPMLGFFPGRHLNLKVLHQQTNYHGIHGTIDAHEFANRMQNTLGLRVTWQWLPVTQFFADASIGYFTGLGEDSAALLRRFFETRR